MLIGENVKVRAINGLKGAELQRIKDYLQGSVYCWCKNRKGDWFTVSDLLGGDNYYWKGTPLLVLYQRQVDASKSSNEAVEQAGKDAGHILKNVLKEDKRTFKTEKGYTRRYLWVD